MKKDLVLYILVISLLYVSGAIVDAMVEAHAKYPSERLFINFYQLFYLVLIMTILIPATVYYGSKLSLKIGPKKTVILLIFLLPFASVLWDMTYGWIINRNPLWINKEIKDWFSMPLPFGELRINIPIWFSTTWIVIRLIVGILLVWLFFKKVLPSKRLEK